MNSKRAEIPEPEIEKQKMIMRRMRDANAGTNAPLAFVDTYGCQQNEADSEILRGMLCEMGYTLTDSEYGADVIVLNTCAIRENAENRVFGNIGELTHTKREKPGQLIAVCGCMAASPKAASKIKESYKHVKLVFPPHTLWRFPELLERALTSRRRVFITDTADGEFTTADDGLANVDGEYGTAVGVLEKSAIAEGLPKKRDSAAKAWLSIMYGCNNFCSYCIVPHVRGRERSREPEAIIVEARGLVAEGFKDITLLGQNVNSYGAGLADSTDFPTLIRRINEIEGDFLIRFMTSHPKDAGDALFSAMADCEKAARHIHLPFQSGSDRILERMNRKYTAAQYLSKVDAARGKMPDIVITSDVIVGFPGETEEDFEETLKLVEKVRFDGLFTFIYSKRPGTPAALMADTLTEPEKHRRFDRLINLQNAISQEKHSEYIGKTIRVLVDGESRGEEYPVRARTNGGRLVHLPEGTEHIGQFVNVRVTDCNSWALYGAIL